jgi:hypothetical protein
MDNLFDDLMECVFIQSMFSLAKIQYVDKNYQWSTSVYIAHKPQGDYFIYLNVPESLLSYVTNDIQIKLASLIKNGSERFEQINGDEVKISSSFDKNATLIILTHHDINLDSNAMKQAISIEEDAYFFKKQVLSIQLRELPIISSYFEEHKGSYITYIQNIISDTERFNEFTSPQLLGLSSKYVEYSFIAKLYEKLPFLALLVDKADQDDLQQKIDGELSDVQRESCNDLLALDTDNLNNWFEELIKEAADD